MGSRRKRQFLGVLWLKNRKWQRRKRKLLLLLALLALLLLQHWLGCVVVVVFLARRGVAVAVVEKRASAG